jgi:phage protein U
MFATLGDIQFDAMTSPSELKSKRPYTYAKHDVVEASPKLQWIGNDLEEIVLKMRWHVAFTNPQTQYDNLKAAADAHQAMTLVFGNGIRRGTYVIQELGEEIWHCADDGSLIFADATVTLLEYISSSADGEARIDDAPAIDPHEQPGASALDLKPGDKSAFNVDEHPVNPNFEVEDPSGAVRAPNSTPAVPTPTPNSSGP